ncbi:MAG: type II toxin-antitoxin system HicB family antitoxin [Candidatus Marsarchaeota archaeon]|nr:type II toxin-antitoxin system HicB family antitoxin [Candidatus Marsarchaeota archaeon]
MQGLEVWKEDGVYIARIQSLHVNTQAKTLKELKKNLEEAIQVAIEGLLEMKKLKHDIKVRA